MRSKNEVLCAAAGRLAKTHKTIFAPNNIYWVIQNDCGQVWQLCTKIYVATVWVG
jgi:hypothetical protein